MSGKLKVISLLQASLTASNKVPHCHIIISRLNLVEKLEYPVHYLFVMELGPQNCQSFVSDSINLIQ